MALYHGLLELWRHQQWITPKLKSGYYCCMNQGLSKQSVSWTMQELGSLFHGVPQTEHIVSGVRVDSRLVQPGDLFVALAGDPGARFNPSARSVVDGHSFVADALTRGAVAALVSKRQPVAISQFETQDTYSGLWRLGAAARARLAGPVIAVTGSSGKTTAKSFLASALAAYSPPGSFNNHIGVPLSLANAWQQAPAWIFEIGTSNPGEIGPLAEMVRPDLAILLNVHNAHIENFASRRALIEEKSAIFSTLEKGGLRVVHDELGMAGYQFGYDASSHARVLDLQGDALSLRLLGERVTARVPGAGAHRALTLSACLLAAKLLDQDLQAGLDLNHDIVPKGRGDIHQCNGMEIVDDSYNANPHSMRAAIDAFLATEAKGRRYLILGDMRELGLESEAAHRQLLENLPKAPTLHGIVIVGEALAQAWSEVSNEQSAALPKATLLGQYNEVSPAMIADVASMLRPNDRVLVKGSNRIFWTEAFVDRLLQQF